MQESEFGHTKDGGAMRFASALVFHSTTITFAIEAITMPPPSILPLDTAIDPTKYTYLPEEDSPGQYKLWRICDEPLRTSASQKVNVIPAIFEVTGEISVEDCFLSTRTDRAFEGLEDGDLPGIATCWMERRDGLGSRIQWQRYLTSLRRLVNLTGVEGIATSALFLDKPGGVPRIHMFRCVAHGHEVRFCWTYVLPKLTMIGNY